MKTNIFQFVKNNLYTVSVFIVIILIIIPFFIASIYSVPSADDYQMALKSINHGYVAYQIDHWTDWNGRYISTAVQSAPYLMGFHIYGLIPIILLGLFIHALYLLIRKVCLLNKMGRTQTFLVALLALTVYILQIPITSNFYWLSGSATYFLPIILFLYFLSVLFDVVYSTTKSVGLTMWGCLLVFVIVGTSETSMLLLDVFLLLLFLIYLIYRRSIDWTLIIFGTVALISSLLVVLAPGNTVRKSNFSGGGDIIIAFKKSVGATIDFSYEWLFVESFLWLFVVILFGASILLFSRFSKEKCHLFNLHPLLALSMVPILTLVGFFVPYYAFGTYGPERTLALVQFVFMFSLAYAILVFAKHFVINICGSLSEKAFKTISYFLKLLLFCVLFSTFVTNQNLRMAYDETLSGKMKTFYNENVAIAEILVKSNTKKVSLPHPSSVPITNSFRGAENFQWMAKYYMKTYSDSMESLSMSDYEIIQRVLPNLAINQGEYNVTFDEESKSLVYQIKNNKKRGMPKYFLNVYPKDSNIFRGVERTLGYVNRPFEWSGIKSEIDGYSYHVVELPRGWEIEKVETGQIDSNGSTIWHFEIEI